MQLSSVFSNYLRSADYSDVVSAKSFSQTFRRKPDLPGTSAAQLVSSKPCPRCQFCGLKQHSRSTCTAKRRDTCLKCSKTRQGASVCRLTGAVLQQLKNDDFETAVVLCSTSLRPASLNLSLTFTGSKEQVQAMIETGSNSFLSATQKPNIAKHGLTLRRK